MDAFFWELNDKDEVKSVDIVAARMEAKNTLSMPSFRGSKNAKFYRILTTYRQYTWKERSIMMLTTSPMLSSSHYAMINHSLCVYDLGPWCVTLAMTFEAFFYVHVS
jgi:hypothetical protein